MIRNKIGFINELAEAFPLEVKSTEAVQFLATILKRKMLTKEMKIRICINEKPLIIYQNPKISERRAIIADGIKIGVLQ